MSLMGGAMRRHRPINLVGANAPVAIDVPLHRVVIECVKLNSGSGIHAQKVRINDGHWNIGNRATGLAGIDQARPDVRWRAALACDRWRVV